MSVQARAKADIAYYDRIAQEYFARHEQPIQRFTTRLEARWLKSDVRPGSRVLLVGAGGGRELPPLLLRGCSVVALDYSKRMLEVGQQRWSGAPVEWVLGDVHELPWAESSFDCVLSLAAVNYFVDLGLALDNMNRVLVSGGRLILSSMNALHASEQGTAGAGRYTRRPYAPAELGGAVAAHGFRVVKMRGFRFWVDRLPREWNTASGRRIGRATLAAGLVLESLLGGLRSPEAGKFFWVVADKTG